jgi:protein gp37
MADGSRIEWTDATWSPVVGCKAISPGCDHCYAARQASGRLKHLTAYAGLAESGAFTGEIRLLPERLDKPLRWKRPRRIFVDSMSDLFHPDVPDDFIGSVFAIMRRAHWHTFQVLTKRPQRMATWVNGSIGIPRNLWLGTSIESDAYAFRANHLRETSAAVRFLSLEPLLGPLPSLSLTDIDWVIVGGESGPGARPMHPDWAREIRWRCAKGTHSDWCNLSLWLDCKDRHTGWWEPQACDCDGHSVPFLFKQWGEWQSGSWLSGGVREHAAVLDDGRFFPSVGLALSLRNAGCSDADFAQHNPTLMARVGRSAAGRVLDGRIWDEYPAPRPSRAQIPRRVLLHPPLQTP